MSALTDAERASLHAALEDRARELRDEVRTVDTERAEAPSRQQDEVGDAGDESEQRSRDEVRDAERQRDAAELEAISAALDRIDAGSYGECVECACDIPLERLKVQPSAARCIDCQEQFEAAQAFGGLNASGPAVR